MKKKVTAKFVKGFCHTIIETGACEVHYLMNGTDPDWYTCGIYGWNADVFYLGNHTAIVSGYRPFGTIRPKYETVKSFEARAKEICDKYRFTDYEEQQKQLASLRQEFLAAVTA